MITNLKLPVITYQEKDKTFVFPEAEIKIAKNSNRLDIYVNSPYLHPQVFQSDESWLLMDVDPIRDRVFDDCSNPDISILVEYLENCQNQIPCHKDYFS